MSVKILSFEIENIKKVKAVTYEPNSNGLTVLGGKNGQGKTSVLDAIAWTLGGNKFAPSEPYRDGSTIPPHLKVTLSNGVIVERSGKNSSLKVIDPTGRRQGQALLDAFVSNFALDLPKFMNSTSKDKGNILLQIIGVGEALHKLDNQEQTLYNQRHAIGQIADQKKKYAREMPVFENVPSEPISALELIKQQQSILARNGENKRIREEKVSLEKCANNLQKEINRLNKELTDVLAKLEIARKTVAELHDESTVEIEKSINDIDEINRKIRANLDKSKAEDDAQIYLDKYDELSKQIEIVRRERTKLLDNADMPLPELTVDNGELLYKGFKWDNISSSEQLKIATAIVRKLNPNCGFVLIDKLEQMDKDTLKEFSAWLEAEKLQAIATRVSSGDECSVIIEDGYIKSDNMNIDTNNITWKTGEF